ncbi:hypothetical protein HS088_TW13G00620 [Tripterygium wilfordii]|uniref:PB1 domain-containing protein n=1 Tax=Tripterygium wilfordii TaxID=458696 RepID=A0A7J7CUI6_TRIWF|nr:uncharacterized protein LOC120011842 [Tripterygium wilfordii]KAF5737731.1 hypothetical protein HS088_TW13G00620 [Tripterygium wilfordii]
MDPPSPPLTASSKIRFMCSYGGHIIPRPSSKSLFYAGGDTRIITVPTTATATLSSLVGHVGTSLGVQYPFTIKYQLPHHDLDSLISLSTDDDLQIMLEEHLRLLSPPPSRIRLFLFATKPSIQQPHRESTQSALKHPKTETWFVDALKGAKIMQRGGNCIGGFGGEAQGEGNGGGGGICGAESLVLETSSSFGSTSSSVSSSNLPPITGQSEESVTNLQDNKVKLTSSDFVTSENSVASAVSQDQGVHVTSMEMESRVHIPSSGAQMHKIVHASDYPLSSHLDQLQQKHHVQFVPLKTNYPMSVLPIQSYYPVYNQQPQLYYLPNQPHPVYLLPVAQPQTYNPSVHCGMAETAPIDPSRSPMHPNVPVIASQVAYKEVNPVSGAANTTFVHVPYSENMQQVGVVPQIHYQPQPADVANRETANYSNELDDDSLRAQIYKSQPPPPLVPSQFQTMTNATAVLLSEALAQLHTDNIEQQARASQPL